MAMGEAARATATTHTIRVTLATHAAVAGLAEDAGVSMGELVERAVEAYRRWQVVAEANRAQREERGDA